jgi:hypothetical protein
MRKIRTVFGAVEVKNPRWMLCQRCLPHTWMAVTVLSEICPDQAMPELMEVTARLGSMCPIARPRSYWLGSSLLSRPKAM